MFEGASPGSKGPNNKSCSPPTFDHKIDSSGLIVELVLSSTDEGSVSRSMDNKNGREVLVVGVYNLLVLLFLVSPRMENTRRRETLNMTSVFEKQ